MQNTSTPELVLKDWRSGSPSQENTYALCKSRWWWDKRTDSPRDESPPTQRGTLLHEIMETYLHSGTMPNIDHIIGLLQKPEYTLCREHYITHGRYTFRTFAEQLNQLAVGGAQFIRQVPAPADRIEAGFRLQTKNMPVPYNGFIDLFDDDGVVDHKLRAAAKYVKWEEELLADPQLRVYCAVYAAIRDADPALRTLDERGRFITHITEPVFRDLTFRHINYCWQERRPVEVEVEVPAKLAEALFKETERISNEMFQYAQVTDPRAIPVDTSACNAFHKECPHLSKCRAYGKISLDPVTEIGHMFAQGNPSPQKGDTMSLKDIMAAMKAQKANAAPVVAVTEPVVEAPVATPEPVAVPPITSLNPPNGVPLGAPVIMGEFDKDRIKQGPFVNGGEVQVSKLRKADLVEALRNQVSNLSAAQKVSVYTEHLDAEALTFEELKGDLKGTVGALRASLALILRVLAGNDDRLLRVYGVEALPKEVTEARKVAVKIDRSGKSKATQLAALLSEGKSADFVRDVNRNLVSPLSADLMQQVLALIPAEPEAQTTLDLPNPPLPPLLDESKVRGVVDKASDEALDTKVREIVESNTVAVQLEEAFKKAITSPKGGVQFGFTGPDPVPGRTSEKPPLPSEVEQVIVDKADAFVAQWERISGEPSFDKVEAVGPFVLTPEMEAFDARMSAGMDYMQGQEQGYKHGYEEGLEAGGKSAHRFLFISGQPRTSAIEVTYIDDFLRPIQERLEKKNGSPYGAVAYSEDFKQMATVLRDLIADNGLDEFPRYLVASNLRRDLPYILEALGSHYIVVN